VPVPCLTQQVQTKLPGITRDDVIDALASKQGTGTKPNANAANLRRQADLTRQSEAIEQSVKDGTVQKPATKPKTEPSAEVKALQDRLDRAKAAAKYYIDSRERTPFAEGLKQTYRASLVSSLGVPLKVLKGFTFSKLADSAASLPAAAFDELLSHATGRRASQIDIQAVTDGLRDAKTKFSLERSWNILMGKEPASTHAGISTNYHGINMGDSLPARAWSKAVNTTFNFHAAAYSPFLDYGYSKSIAEQAGLAARNAGDPSLRAKLIADPTKEMIARASNEAKEGILQNQNRLGSMISNRKGLATSPVGQVADLAATTVVPVPNIASNAAGRLLESSPLGFGKSALEAAKAIKEGKAGNVEESFQAQREASKSFGRATVGTFGLFAAGYILAKKGLLTGEYSQGVNSHRQNDQGGHGNINLPGIGWTTLDDSPQGLAMAIGAAAFEHHEKALADAKTKSYPVPNPDPFWSRAGDVAKQFGVKNPLYEGFETVKRGFEKPQAFAENVGTALVPSLSNSIAKMTDRGQDRETKTFGQKLEARIPGLRQTLPPGDVHWVQAQAKAANVADPFKSYQSMMDDAKTDADRSKIEDQMRKAAADIRKFLQANMNGKGPEQQKSIVRSALQGQKMPKSSGGPTGLHLSGVK